MISKKIWRVTLVEREDGDYETSAAKLLKDLSAEFPGIERADVIHDPFNPRDIMLVLEAHFVDND